MIKELVYKDHEEWLQIRNKYIGGSDAGTVIGTNPYKSRYSLWAEKTGKSEGFAGNLTTETGAYLEDFVAKQFEKATGKKVRRKNRTIVNDKYPFACANVDRVVIGEDAGLECKTTNNDLVIKQCKHSEFPEAYYAQCVHYMAITGKKRWYLGVLIQCREFKWYVLERDEDEIEALMSLESDFWDLVESDTQPAVDGSESTADAISKQYPKSSDDVVEMDSIKDKVFKYWSLGKSIDALKDERELIGNEIKLHMKDAGKGETDGFKISFTSYDKKSFDSKKFLEDHKDIDTDGYYKTSTTRTLRITEKKEN